MVFLKVYYCYNTLIKNFKNQPDDHASIANKHAHKGLHMDQSSGSTQFLENESLRLRRQQ